VMNRGRGRQWVFPDDDYYEAYLQCLAEAHDRFGVEVHAYCLMGNHYHLLIKTPRGNLSRAMRHIKDRINMAAMFNFANAPLKTSQNKHGSHV